MTARCVWCGRFKRDFCQCEELRLYRIADGVLMMGVITTLITSPTIGDVIARIRDMQPMLGDDPREHGPA